MSKTYTIAGYCRISVDEELDRDNVSIENQKSIIEDFVREHFPDSVLHFYEDRDRSGYTFEQREQYQLLRRSLLAHQTDILIVKDFSRFARRNSRGLVELEDLRDAGVRIISIGDGIDFPNDDDWLKIQFQFLINEMPVTDTSKKVRSVIRRRQEEGRWICAAPYGYRLGRQVPFEIVPEEAAVVREIFRLYLEGWGYKRIAGSLTDAGIPTPRMAERERREANGETCRRPVSPVWSVITIQGILANDFYTGTLRQGKYTRRKINGPESRQNPADQLVFEQHHPAVLDAPTFAAAAAMRERRSTTAYRGVRKEEHMYTGFLFCGDCGSPLFSMSRPGAPDAYHCGLYHRRGRSGCTSHHIRADRLDALLKEYVCFLRQRTETMLAPFQADLEAGEQEQAAEDISLARSLEDALRTAKEEWKTTKRQRIRDITRHPEQEAVLEETYDALEADLARRTDSIRQQLEQAVRREQTSRQLHRTAAAVSDIFDRILRKDRLDRQDIQLLVEKITVYENRLDIRLRADIDALLEAGTDKAAPDDPVLVQTAEKHPDRLFRIHVVREGDPLEIYTDHEGEVIFKKYSPIGELSSFASQYAETLYKTCGMAVIICDRDVVIACAGVPKREYTERKLSPEAEQIVEKRQLYTAPAGESIPIIDGGLPVRCLMPIITEGDITGCVASVRTSEEAAAPEPEEKLIQTAASFLGRQLES